MQADGGRFILKTLQVCTPIPDQQGGASAHLTFNLRPRGSLRHLTECFLKTGERGGLKKIRVRKINDDDDDDVPQVSST